jgi:hypothetical protein
MSTATIPGRLTVDEFLSGPEREDGLQEELIEGDVLLSPYPNKILNANCSRWKIVDSLFEVKLLAG